MLRENPEHVSPEASVLRRMRVAILIAERMMFAVIGHPVDRRSLSRNSTEKGEQEPHHTRCLETAVGKQSVIPKADSQAAGNPVERHADGETGPRETERGSKCREVHAPDPDHRRPVEIFRGVAEAFAPRFLFFHRQRIVDRGPAKLLHVVGDSSRRV